MRDVRLRFSHGSPEIVDDELAAFGEVDRGRVEVADARARRCRFEAARLGDDPVRHEPAVRRAHHTEAIRIGDAAATSVSTPAMMSLVVAFAPGVDHPLAGLAVAGAAARHRKEDRVACACQRFGRVGVDLPAVCMNCGKTP